MTFKSIKNVKKKSGFPTLWGEKAKNYLKSM